MWRGLPAALAALRDRFAGVGEQRLDHGCGPGH